MSNKIALLLLCMLFLVGCAQQQSIQIEKDSDEYNIVDQEPPLEVQSEPLPTTASGTLPSSGLGNVCSTKEECLAFCQSNLGRCEEYCQGNENKLCKIIFPPEEKKSKTTSSQDQKPVLENLGINIESWNKQTNLAGDLMFDKGVIYDDGRVANDKVFIDFGHADKYRKENKYSIEYWFFVPMGTKVRAPLDGIVSTGFIEHTKDWGVNIVPKGSPWMVSFEHVANLKVKDGDPVNAGDVVAEAAPRINKEIAMVELAVWTGGTSIIKHCPFEFLDDSLRPIYEEKINKLVKDWEEFIGKDVYKQEDWVAPGCLLHNITEK